MIVVEKQPRPALALSAQRQCAHVKFDYGQSRHIRGLNYYPAPPPPPPPPPPPSSHRRSRRLDRQQPTFRYPLHNPSNAAHVSVPQAPLGNATNGPIKPLGAKAMFDRRFAKQNSNFVSPTDNMMTPTTQKINAAKKKHFNKGAKPMGGLFQQKEATSEDASSGEDIDESTAAVEAEDGPVTHSVTDTDDNPF
ncbi:unnamed protein product [Peniophora sp. CBMAI 1063]|nr:unnamed protein product [Peniophora sp. CBMAI 1063]